mmetsp:Transcript_19637/g.75379  ORF Transcript_19637/g.75379 Transcript_19637/m.75379 type:complete len:349 (+) Transcript_19637:3521-4567(+)
MGRWGSPWTGDFVPRGHRSLAGELRRGEGRKRGIGALPRTDCCRAPSARCVGRRAAINARAAQALVVLVVRRVRGRRAADSVRPSAATANRGAASGPRCGGGLLGESGHPCHGRDASRTSCLGQRLLHCLHPRQGDPEQHTSCLAAVPLPRPGTRGGGLGRRPVASPGTRACAEALASGAASQRKLPSSWHGLGRRSDNRWRTEPESNRCPGPSLHSFAGGARRSSPGGSGGHSGRHPKPGRNGFSVLPDAAAHFASVSEPDAVNVVAQLVPQLQAAASPGQPELRNDLRKRGSSANRRGSKVGVARRAALAEGVAEGVALHAAHRLCWVVRLAAWNRPEAVLEPALC